MKKATKTITRLNLIALIFDTLWLGAAFWVITRFFTLLEVPENPEHIIIRDYDFLGMTLSSAQVNLWIGLLIGYLLVFFPVWIMNIKKITDRDRIEYDDWSHRFPLLVGVISFLTTNVIGGVLHIISGYEVKKVYYGYGFKQSWKNHGRFFTSLFKKETYHKRKEKQEISKGQQDTDDMAKRDFAFKIVRVTMTYFFLAIFALFIFIPFYWMLLTALKSNMELTQAINPRYWMGLSEMNWVNFKIALTRFDFTNYMMNTLIVAFWSTIGTIFTTVFAAFAFARLEFKGREFVFTLLLMTMMIPGELYVITNYVTVTRTLQWYNSFNALIFPFITSVFYIFFLRQTFKQIPDSLYRAARVDGCGDLKYLLRVMLPIAAPTIITITILNAIGSWNAYIWPRLVTEQENWLVAVALRNANFSAGFGDARTMVNIQIAASAAVTLPIIFIFLLLRKYIMAGVGRSGTKG